MKTFSFYVFTIGILVFACAVSEPNPFDAVWDTPFSTPPFDKIKTKHYKPAMLKGIELENGEENNYGRTKTFVKKIERLAKKYNLILTSGSDFHGKGLTEFTGTHKLGKYNSDEKIVSQLEDLK